MDKNPPANEGDRGSILDLERSKARAPQLLKPGCLEPVLYNKRSHHTEKLFMHSNEEEPLKLEKACVQQQRPTATKKK